MIESRSNVPGQMTKMVAMLIFKTSFALELEIRCSIGDVVPPKFVQMMIVNSLPFLMST